MRRLGKVQYMKEFADTDWFGGVLAKLSLVPMTLEYDSVFETYTLTGTSHFFSEIAEAQKIPEYMIRLRQAKEGPPEFDGISRVVVDGGLMPWELPHANA